MRVLHVIDGIDVGGAELVLAQLIEHLQKLGYRNTVLVMTEAGPVGDRVRASNAELLEMKCARGRLPLSGIVRMVSAFRGAAPDLVQGWMYHGNIAATVLNSLSGVRAPVLWSVHNTLGLGQDFATITRWALAANRALSGRVDGIVYVSEASARQHEERGFRADRARTIPNGTDTRLFAPKPTERAALREAFDVADCVPLVGTFARWATMKGHSVLFSAASRLQDRGLPVHLVLAGSGMTPDNPGLAAQIGAAGLASHISCLGARHDIPTLMAGLDAFVLPSVQGEAFPLVLGEAMATEVPCIATDVGDVRLILGDTGEVVQPGDAEALASALERLLILPSEARIRLGRLGRDRVVARFSLERMGDAYDKLYRSVALRPDEPQIRADASGDA